MFEHEWDEDDEDDEDRVPVHVYPLIEVFEFVSKDHKTNGEKCWCEPRIEDDGYLIVHKRMQ